MFSADCFVDPISLLDIDRLPEMSLLETINAELNDQVVFGNQEKRISSLFDLDTERERETRMEDDDTAVEREENMRLQCDKQHTNTYEREEEEEEDAGLFFFTDKNSSDTAVYPTFPANKTMCATFPTGQTQYPSKFNFSTTQENNETPVKAVNAVRAVKAVKAVKASLVSSRPSSCPPKIDLRPLSKLCNIPCTLTIGHKAVFRVVTVKALYIGGKLTFHLYLCGFNVVVELFSFFLAIRHGIRWFKKVGRPYVLC